MEDIKKKKQKKIDQETLYSEVDIEEIEIEKSKKESERCVKGDKPLIKFENVSKTYKGDFVALTNINLEIQSGEFVSIIGHSGAGKSTMLKLIYAEEIPTEGEVIFDGESLKKISRRKIPMHRRKIGTIFQDFKLIPKKTVFENVAYALEVCGASEKEIIENVPQILDIVGLGNKMEKFPSQLSGGEQQKTVLARALIHKPMVIVADEPTGNLDPESSMDILNLLLKINKIGTTVILASHNKDIINKAGKRVITIEEGEIIGDENKGKYKIC